jgi:hypothetical protein
MLSNDLFYFSSARGKLPPIHTTLPLSGRQGAWGGAAEGWWWPVHSRGLLEGCLIYHSEIKMTAATEKTSQDLRTSRTQVERSER